MLIQNSFDFMAIGTLRNEYKKYSIKNALDQKCNYIIVVCDTFDWSDYCVPVKDSDLEDKIEYYRKASMQKVMGVYDISRAHFFGLDK